jgi:nucleotide-binding universal stress UspA family protein
MTRTFMVPLDGSELAERALPYAVRLAQGGGQLVLVRAATANAPMTIDGTNWERDQRDAVDEAERYLEGVQARLHNEVPSTVDVPYGPAAKELLATIRRFKPDAVVMATHGRTGLAHLVHGSVAEVILAGSHVPVLLLGSHVEPPVQPSIGTRVLVPLDASPLAESAIDVALGYLKGSNHPLLVLATVVAEPDHVEQDERGRVLAYVDQQEEAQTRGAREYLEHVTTAIHQAAPEVSVSLDVEIGAADTGITWLAAKHQVDLIVMASHARTGLERIRLGSVAGSVLRDSRVPVLVVRPEAPVTAGVERD